MKVWMTHWHLFAEHMKRADTHQNPDSLSTLVLICERKMATRGYANVFNQCCKGRHNTAYLICKCSLSPLASQLHIHSSVVTVGIYRIWCNNLSIICTIIYLSAIKMCEREKNKQGWGRISPGHNWAEHRTKAEHRFSIRSLATIAVCLLDH